MSPMNVSPINVSPINVSPINVSPINVSPINVSAIDMSPIKASTSASTRARSLRGTFACAALVLALSVATGVSAQTPTDNELAAAPKQVGAWTITGWNQGYCAAERPVQGADGGSSALQFIIARLRSGYRLGLSASEWELPPKTEFPIEMVAGAEFRSESKAVAVAPKLVIIELGADRQLVNKIAAASTIDIKAAQTTFKLPMDGFDNALAEVETCFGALNKPASNPFTGPAAAKPERAGNASAPDAPTKVTTVNSMPEEKPPSATPASDDLIEERTFLTVPGEKGSYRLEALVVRPAKADGRLPIALITHGKNPTAADNQALRADLMRPQARDFAARGWLAVVVIRRGYGRSDGFPGVSRGAFYMTCQNSDLVRGFDIEADDLAGALKALANREDADLSRVIAVGQSLGGGTVLAFAARRPAGLVAIVNVSGGVWRTEGNGVCDHADLVEAMATFGSRTRVPSLWLYSENDSLFPPALVKSMRDAYAQAGGEAELRMFPPVLGDGHALFMDSAARVKWLSAFDTFMQTQQTSRPVVTGALKPDTIAR